MVVVLNVVLKLALKPALLGGNAVSYYGGKFSCSQPEAENMYLSYSGLDAIAIFYLQDLVENRAYSGVRALHLKLQMFATFEYRFASKVFTGLVGSWT